MADVKGLRATLSFIQANPQLWRQDSWLHCFAAIAVELAGYDVLPSLWVRLGNRSVHVWDAAADVLDLTGDEARLLFAPQQHTGRSAVAHRRDRPAPTDPGPRPSPEADPLTARHCPGPAGCQGGAACQPAHGLTHPFREDHLADATLTRRQRWTIAAMAIATVVVVLGLIAAVYTVIQHQRAASQATVTITVLDKKADCTTPTTGAASCTWRIFTDAGVFADRDEVTAHKMNSQVLYSQLMYGGVYEVEIRGTRHDNLGDYPNIIRIVRVISPGHPNPAVVIATTTP